MSDNLFLLLTMSALKCYKFQARTFLEMYNQLWLMGPCFKGYLSYKFDRPEAIRARAKTDEFLRSLGPETLRKLFGALEGLCKVRMRTADADGGRRMRTADNYKIRKIRKDRSFSSFNLRTIACNLYPCGLLLIQK